MATGAEPLVPIVEGDGSVPVITTDDHIRLGGGIEGLLGRNIIVMDEDGYYWTSAVSESVIATGATPIVISRVFEVCRELPMVSRIEYLRQLDKNAGGAIPNSYIARIEKGYVVIRHYLTERETKIDDVAAVVWVGRRAQTLTLPLNCEMLASKNTLST